MRLLYMVYEYVAGDKYMYFAYTYTRVQSLLWGVMQFYTKTTNMFCWTQTHMLPGINTYTCLSHLPCIYLQTMFSSLDPILNPVLEVQSSLSCRALYRDHTHLERTHILRSKCHEYCECMWCSHTPEDTSLLRTELFGRRGVLIKRGLL